MSYNAIIPSIFGKDWWDAWDYPSSILDQCFALPLSEADLLGRVQDRSGIIYRPRCQANIDASGKSEVTNDENQFKVALNVTQFKPEEIKVKVVENFIVIHGKHEEKTDDHGFVSREFTRRYMLPKSCEMGTVSSSMSSEGMLNITAPKKTGEELLKRIREIPIMMENL